MSEQRWIPQKGEWALRIELYVPIPGWVSNLPFMVVERARLRNPETQEFVDEILLHDEAGKKHPLSECLPVGETKLLADWEVETVVLMCRAMSDTNDFTDIELLDYLSDTQRSQVFEAIGYAPALHRAIERRNEEEIASHA